MKYINDINNKHTYTYLNIISNKKLKNVMFIKI